MRISFLLGPAGSGKTYRCLEAIRDRLASCPEGLPLILLAPRQATFQLERQLLEGSRISGFSRLRILSFERLARHIFEHFRKPEPQCISEEGRIMVLRSILSAVHRELGIFSSAARRLGFAEELSRQFREFQNHGLNPKGVRRLATEMQGVTRDKLVDFAMLFERYLGWLEEKKLRDPDALLADAADLMEQADSREFRVGGIWFDGFAQLTPVERRLLAAVLPHCTEATLAFCAEAETLERSTLSPWHLVSRTFHLLRTEIDARCGEFAEITVDRLAREPLRTRFSSSPVLARLESNWARVDNSEPLDPAGSLLAVQCADPEAEVMHCAREIVRHVRAGGRYRDVALILRSLENDFPHLLRRIFRRYQIPFFLDHRECVSHHPMAELTRSALRTVAFNFRHQDWFSALKTGLVHFPQDKLDTLENESLAHGWEGAAWRTGLRLAKDPDREAHLNRWREQLTAPFLELEECLGTEPSANKLASGLRELWENLTVEKHLEDWSNQNPNEALHSTVWDQMNSWLENLELAFGNQRLPLPEWLPILESGLAGLTVGVIPPVLDQVLIGAVDRSRNPDLKLVFIPGFNERNFPALPARDRLLTEDDRAALAATGCELARIPAAQIAEEQFYGYIACTRARERLVLTYSRAALDGTALNPSRFLGQLRRIFPKLEPIQWQTPTNLVDLVHLCELAAIPALGTRFTPGTDEFQIQVPDSADKLSPELAARLYGDELTISVSSLERFAACPFRFFVEKGLNVRERKEFALDVREKGTFQHLVLSEFHAEATSQGRRWRDLSIQEGREMVGRIADKHAAEFHDGLLQATEQNRFTASVYKSALQDFIEVILEWLQTNEFDPVEVELGFGPGTPLPGWRVPIGQGRALLIQGRIDRVDLFRVSPTEALCVVLDYKSSAKPPRRELMHHGIQQQLPAYLLALTSIPEMAARFGVEKITPAGCFLLPLSIRHASTAHREEALANPGKDRKKCHTHNGIFDLTHLKLLDTTAPEEDSLQFKRRLTKDQKPYAKTFNALTSDDFESNLARCKEVIRECGERIFSGEIRIHPYKLKSMTACDQCQMQPVCRFDPWTQEYKVLSNAVSAAPSSPAPSPQAASPAKNTRKKTQ